MPCGNLTACRHLYSGRAFDSDFKTIDAEGWTKSSPLVFLQPDSIRGVDAYDIAVSVRHDNYYPYRNLLLIVDYVAGDKIVEHDTVNVKLCDEYGDWGGSGLGKLFQKQMLIKSGCLWDAMTKSLCGTICVCRR